MLELLRSFHLREGVSDQSAGSKTEKLTSVRDENERVLFLERVVACENLQSFLRLRENGSALFKNPVLRGMA